MKYTHFDKCIIVLDDNDIIIDIKNFAETKKYKRLGSEKATYICGLSLPKSHERLIFKDLDILKKILKIYDYDNETTGLHTEYYYNGNIYIKYYQINKIKEGLYTRYHNNGVLELECNYINNILNGQYTQYDEKNRIVRTCFYIDGKLDGNETIYNYKNIQNNIIMKMEFAKENLK